MISLQYLHGIGNGIPRGGKQTQIDEAILDFELDDLLVLPLADEFKYPPQLVFDLVIRQHLVSVFWGPNNTILQVVKTIR